MVFNDSAFFYSDSLPSVIHYASVAASTLMLTPAKRGGPIPVRGAIAATASPPTYVAQPANDVCPTYAGRFVVDSIGAALIADKRHLLGARIVFPEALLAQADFTNWDVRLQAKVMKADHSPKLRDADLLHPIPGLEDYLDVAWMNQPQDTQFERIGANVTTMWKSAGLSERSSLHASATWALYQATLQKRHGTVVILSRLWSAIQQRHTTRLKRPSSSDYAAWMAVAPRIRAARDGDLILPYKNDLVLGGSARPS